MIHYDRKENSHFVLKIVYLVSNYWRVVKDGSRIKDCNNSKYNIVVLCQA